MSEQNLQISNFEDLGIFGYRSKTSRIEILKIWKSLDMDRKYLEVKFGRSGDFCIIDQNLQN